MLTCPVPAPSRRPWSLCSRPSPPASLGITGNVSQPPVTRIWSVMKFTFHSGIVYLGMKNSPWGAERRTEPPASWLRSSPRRLSVLGAPRLLGPGRGPQGVRGDRTGREGILEGSGRRGSGRARGAAFGGPASASRVLRPETAHQPTEDVQAPAGGFGGGSAFPRSAPLPRIAGVPPAVDSARGSGGCALGSLGGTRLGSRRALRLLARTAGRQASRSPPLPETGVGRTCSLCWGPGAR